MSVINTNYLALVSQNNLTKSQGALGTAIERLSSGLRINSAKDDAAGQAIANRFTANIKGLTQAARNANDGISIAQTTEGSLNEINNNLQRIRELTVQAANDSNSPDDLKSIQNEITERLDEIDRVSRETQFNGKYVLSESGSLSVQVGAHDSQRINIDLKQIDRGTLGLTNLNMNSQYTSKGLTEVTGNISEVTAAKTVELDFPDSAVELELFVGDDGKLYGKQGTDFYDVTYDGAAGTVTFKSDATTPPTPTDSGATTFVDASGNLVELSTAKAATQVDTAAASTYEVYQNKTTGALVVWDGTDSWAIDGTNNSIDLETGEVTLTKADGTATDPTSTSDKVSTGEILTLNGQAAVAVDLATVDAELTDGTNSLMQAKDGSYLVRNTDGDNITYYSAEVNPGSGEVTLGEEVMVDPLAALDDALQQVDDLRSHLGAIQNRFESTIANLNNTVNNLSAARSRIEDADYAVEVSNMTRAQILQQAGTSVLAQANQIPQTVLSLLR